MILSLRSPLWRRVARVAARQLFRLAENNDEPRFERNGERWLLDQLLASHAAKTKESFVAFDAGANVGDYTRAILQAARKTGAAALVHAFEPSPHCVEKLREDFVSDSSVRIVSSGVSDRKGDAPLYADKAGSSLASVVARDDLNFAPEGALAVRLLRLDEYMAEQSVSRVDLLKLDIEGSELAALRGLGDCLRPEIIDVIQFEYGGAALDAGTSLRDIYRLLEARGYVLAKLFPRALEVRAYRVWMEHYAYANYVALSPRWLASRRAAS